jgi:hypothetical protein
MFKDKTKQNFFHKPGSLDTQKKSAIFTIRINFFTMLQDRLVVHYLLKSLFWLKAKIIASRNDIWNRVYGSLKDARLCWRWQNFSVTFLKY